ncbi:MAG TPA: serine hydrolase domain-containing protein [Candidatus Tectomicrobia bacterium]|nr:serine hydrolase domain-containing protein [Candidatus Tectomicrobia bacterium]
MERPQGSVLVATLLCVMVAWVGSPRAAGDPSQASPPVQSVLDAALPPLMERARVPGVALAVVEAGDVAWVRGYGWADAQTRQPVTAHTLFQAASISKPVSAWVAMRLVEAGTLDLDRPVAHYLTRWQLPASPFDPRGVTLRRMLSHTAGLSIPGYLGFAPGQRVQPLEESLTSAADAAGGEQPLAVIFPPGQEWHYSGGGYTLLQLIVEQVTGQAFAGFARRTVLEPLGMRQSTFEEPPRAQRALAYDRTGAPTPEYRFTALAAAGLWASAGDLARFVAALMAGPRGETPGRQVLEPATVARMLSPQAHSANDLLFRGSMWGLGYGLKRVPATGQLLAYHPGDNPPGWHGLIAALPSRRVGLVVLTNGEAGQELRLEAFCLWWRFQGAGPLDECAASAR